MLKIGIIGVGTVGTSVCQILEDNQDIITARAGVKLKVVSGVVNNLSKKRDVNSDIKITNNVDDILEDNSIDIVVELMGGIDEPNNVVKKALRNGKSVVTANKALLAYHRYELEKVKKDTIFEYEAAVCGGIPIIGALRDGLTANHISSIKGIMNGTTNYMLDCMMNSDVTYDAILKKAQELGYAEADPTLDVGGFDAAHKLLILASIAYGIDAKPEDILIEGINNITNEDIDFAKEFNYTLKSLGIAKRKGDAVELRVHTTFVPKDEMIAKVDGVMNAVSITGDKVGETLFYGAGAGGDATASAVIANIVDIARRGNSKSASPMLGFKEDLVNKLKLSPIDNIETKYYLRIPVLDRAGVLAEVCSILGKHKISIKTVLQKPKEKNEATLLLSTHTCREKDIKFAINEIEEVNSIIGKLSMIRIEE